jgi:hypothetical protein
MFFDLNEIYLEFPMQEGRLLCIILMINAKQIPKIKFVQHRTNKHKFDVWLQDFEVRGWRTVQHMCPRSTSISLEWLQDSKCIRVRVFL